MDLNSTYAKSLLTFKKIGLWLGIENSLIKLLRVPFVTTTVPTFTGIYFTTYEIFGNKWTFFTLHNQTHEIIISILIAATVIVALIKGLTDSYVNRRVHQYLDLLHNFIRMNGSIVNVKDERFKDAATKLTENTDIFSLITHPKTQINQILRHSKEFLIHNFSLESEENLRITIIERNDDSWNFSFDTHPSWHDGTTEALDLLTSDSAAHKCCSTGEPILLPDKAIAESNGDYIQSPRDKRTGAGSVYCYPIFVNCGNRQNVSIITIVTYNSKRLTNGYDQGEFNQVQTILKEICRRIELEVTLKTIRDWSISYSIKAEVGE